jgi:hypothetical protein
MINRVSAKWALVCGMFSFLTWTGANFYPKFYTLIPTAIFSGCGQGILWTAEVSYVLKLAFDSSKITLFTYQSFDFVLILYMETEHHMVSLKWTRKTPKILYQHLRN